MSSKFVRRNSIKKYLDIFLCEYRLGLLQNREFKTNLYSCIGFDLMLTFAQIIFFFIYGQLVFEYLSWRLLDYFIFFFFVLLASKITYILCFRQLNFRLLQGELNNTLLKPINPYFFTSVKPISGPNALTLIYMLIISLPLVFFASYNHIFLGYLLFLFGNIFYYFFYNFFESFAFFIKRSDFLVTIFSKEINFAIEDFTPRLFYKTPFQWIAFAMPAAIYGFFTIEVFRREFDLLLFFLPYLLGLFMFLVLGNYLLWHYGLKKYEAYG